MRGSLALVVAGATALSAALVTFASPRAFGQETKLAAAKAAAKANGKDYGASFALGRALRRAAHWAEAKVELAHAAALGKGDEAVRAKYEIALVELDQGATNPSLPTPPAVATCKKVQTGTSGEALMHVCTAEAWLSFARTVIAGEELDKAEKIDAGLYELKLARALVDVTNGSHDDAVTKLKALTAATADRVEGWLWLGRELMAKGDRAAAVAPLKKARDLDADYPEVQLELARALPDGTEARDVAKLAVSMRSEWADAEARLGELELAVGSAEDARRAFEIALKKNPKHVAAKIGLAWAYVKLKEFDDAKTTAIEAEKLAGNSARARMAHAEALAGLGEVDEAVETFKFAAGLDTKDPTPLIRAAQVLLAAKQPMKAEGHAAAAVKQFPNDARAWEVMGDVHAANGDKKEAKDAYKKALSAKEGTIDKAAVQKKLDAIK